MLRLYHTLKSLYAVIAAVFLLLLVAWFSPFYKHLPVIVKVTHSFLFGRTENLKNYNSQTNFLILGLGGEKSQPGSLTDTQQLFFYDHKGVRHLLLSIPRDIWLPDLGLKINSAYAYGNSLEGSGIEVTKDAATKITGQPIHYSVVVSFDGFVRLVDLVGGIDVEVERSFTDTRYPIRGRENDLCGGDTEYRCRWETVTFGKGKSHFDGQTALKFVRSRQARGDEGTDFARAARQQKAMLAIKEKILSPAFFLNSPKIEQLFGLTEEVFETDIPQSDLGIVIRAFLEAKREKVYTAAIPAIDPANPDENLEKSALLIHPPLSPVYKNQWVLVPIGGSWEPTRVWVACLLIRDDCTIGGRRDQLTL